MNSNKENRERPQVIYTLPPRMEKVVSDRSKELAISPQEALEVIIREWMLTARTSGERPSERILLLSELEQRLATVEGHLKRHQEDIEKIWTVVMF